MGDELFGEHPQFGLGERATDTTMDTPAKGHMGEIVAVGVERCRILETVRVAVRRRVEQGHFVAEPSWWSNRR